MESELPDIHEIARQGEVAATISLSVPTSLSALAGHFPGHPIVPGYVLIRWVIALSAAAFSANWHLSKAKAFKFLKPVCPGAGLLLSLRRESQVQEQCESTLLHFEYRNSAENELVARGILTLQCPI